MPAGSRCIGSSRPGSDLGVGSAAAEHSKGKDGMDIEQRIERLLDQLENPNLSQCEIDKIEAKLKVLRSQAQQ